MANIPQLNPQYPDYGNALAKGAYIKGAENRNALTEMQMKDYPEERNYLRKQRGWAEEDRATSLEDRKLQLQDRLRRMTREDVLWEDKILKTGLAGLAQVNSVSDYAAYYKWATAPNEQKGLGLNPELLDDPSNFIRADGMADEQAFDQYRISKLQTGAEVLKEYEPYTLPANS